MEARTWAKEITRLLEEVQYIPSLTVDERFALFRVEQAAVELRHQLLMLELNQESRIDTDGEEVRLS